MLYACHSCCLARCAGLESDNGESSVAPSPPASPPHADLDDSGNWSDDEADEEEDNLDDDALDGNGAGCRPRRGNGVVSGPRHIARRLGERRDPHGTVMVGYLTELYTSPRFEELGPEVCRARPEMNSAARTAARTPPPSSAVVAVAHAQK